MKKHTQNKRLEMKAMKESRYKAVSLFKTDHPGVTIYTDHYMDSQSQWVDFRFLHPTRHLIVSVALQTLTMKYHSLCEEEASERASAWEPKAEKTALDNLFKPIYFTPKHSQRPRVRYYQMRQTPPDVMAQRQAFYASKDALTAVLEDERTFQVCESVEVYPRHYGLFADVVIDAPFIDETTLELARDKILGLIPLSKEMKTFSHEEIKQSFGAEEEVPASNPVTPYSFESSK